MFFFGLALARPKESKNFLSGKILKSEKTEKFKIVGN